jgi:hypothetical protein
MKTSLRVVLFCLALVAALGSVSPDSRGYSTEYWFYDSSDPNVIVGEGWTDCEWRFHLWWGVWKPLTALILSVAVIRCCAGRVHKGTSADLQLGALGIETPHYAFA